MAARRPLHDEAALLAASDKIWKNLHEPDWLQAFRSHPRVGESKAPAAASALSAAWSKNEQQRVGDAADAVKTALAEGNRAYEKRFGYIFIICASGRSGPDILAALERRLRNDDKTEMHEASDQQRQITHLRLKKWLTS